MDSQDTISHNFLFTDATLQVTPSPAVVDEEEYS